MASSRVVSTRVVRPVKVEPVNDDLQVLLDYITERDITFPKDAVKELGIDRKTFNSLAQKLVMQGLVTRIEGENATNPRFKLREKGEPSKRKETETDSGNRKKVEPEKVVEVLREKGDLRARDLATEILGNDNFSSIKALNSALHKLSLDGVVRRFDVEDNEAHYEVIE